jgi:putative SOS response-associated peptidase YedK
MCGRFFATSTFREIRLRWNIRGDDDCPLFAPRFNIAPSQQVPVIVSDDGTRDIKRMQWGLVPAWAKDPCIGTKRSTLGM